MRLSVVVVVHDMPFAATRTLQSLSPGYQRDVAAADYEVIVVDNGSTRPIDPDRVRTLRGTFRYLPLDDARPSPARAANAGLAAARGDLVGLILDGARLATPRLLAFAMQAAATHPRPIVATAGWLLGRGGSRPRAAADTAETSARLDAFLHAAGWPDDPYRLFDVSRLDAAGHWFGDLFESPALFLPRALWTELGGLDERFDEPGGGFLALDVYERALGLPDSAPIFLLGEGTMHQPHGGISTDAPDGATLDERVADWHARYRALRGRDLQLSDREFLYFGSLPSPWRVQLVATMLGWTVDAMPELIDLADLLEPGANASGAGGGSAWGELEVVRDRMLFARRQAMTAQADLARVYATWSWRLTAPLRRLAASARRWLS